MYEGFKRFEIQTTDPEVKIVGRVGGNGPPLLLLHGNPLTHVHWHLVAPRLAQDFTVVATDLRGYGDSGKPRGLPDHSNYSFRRMAQDQVDVMAHLGFDKFCVAGHDRGARTAYRMALDHPDKVHKFASIDIMPTHYVLTHVNREWALNSYPLVLHGAALRHPGEAARGQGALLHRARSSPRWASARAASRPETLAEYARVLHAGEHARRVRGLPRRGDARFRDGQGRLRGGAQDPMPDVRSSGASRATPKRCSTRARRGRSTAANIVNIWPLPCGHYPAEQVPDEVFSELSAFFNG